MAKIQALCWGFFGSSVEMGERCHCRGFVMVRQSDWLDGKPPRLGHLWGRSNIWDLEISRSTYRCGVSHFFGILKFLNGRLVSGEYCGVGQGEITPLFAAVAGWDVGMWLGEKSRFTVLGARWQGIIGPYAFSCVGFVWHHVCRRLQASMGGGGTNSYQDDLGLP